jgi:hypothetical protein
MYAGSDLVFQLVMLGPVRTAMYTMADRFPAWMVRVKETFSASLDGTVHAITRFAGTRRRKLFYPRRAVALYLGMGVCRAVVPGFFRGRTPLSGGERRAAPEASAGGAEGSVPCR